MQATWETQVQSLEDHQEDPLEEGVAAHSNVLARRIPWREEPGGLWSVGLQRVVHNWSDLACTHAVGIWGGIKLKITVAVAEFMIITFTKTDNDNTIPETFSFSKWKLLLKFDTSSTHVKWNLVYFAIAFDKLSYSFFWGKYIWSKKLEGVARNLDSNTDNSDSLMVTEKTTKVNLQIDL